MPPLVAFGRKWDVGSDDLVFPGTAFLLAKGAWALALVGSLIYHRKAVTCPCPPVQESRRLVAFFSASISFAAVAWAVDLAIVLFSARGSVVRAGPRKPVAHLLHLRAVLFFLEVLLQVVLSVLVYAGRHDTYYNANTHDGATELPLLQQATSASVCAVNLDGAFQASQVITAVNWFALGTLAVCVFVYVDPCYCYRPRNSADMSLEARFRGEETEREVVEQNWKLTYVGWRKRFRQFYVCGYGGEYKHDSVCNDLADIFTNIFCETNVVLSDVIAGFALLQTEHASTQGKRESQASEGVRVRVKFEVEEERKVFENAFYYHKCYGIAMYTVLLFIFTKPCCWCCNLCCKPQNSHCCRFHGIRTRFRYRNEPIHVDNVCHAHTTVLLQESGLNREDLIYVTFKNDLYQTPFMVCLDHNKQTVVIAIRGTLSTHDVMSDLNANPNPIDLSAFPDFHVHRGMYHCFKWVLEQLSKENLLSIAFERCPNYKLVVTGHSLGSGVACLLSMYLRSNYPDLHCYCISPSGAIANEAAARYTEAFTTSVTYGDDFIARLNINTGHRLKEDIARVLRKNRKPKYRIFMEGSLVTLCTCYRLPFAIEQEDQSDTLSNEELGGSSEGGSDEGKEEEQDSEDESSCLIRPLRGHSEVTPVIREGLSYRNTVRHTADSIDQLEMLYMPGKIMHIVEEQDPRSVRVCRENKFEVYWTHRSAFDRIIVTPFVMSDHFPHKICGAMKAVLRQKHMPKGST